MGGASGKLWKSNCDGREIEHSYLQASMASRGGDAVANFMPGIYGIAVRLLRHAESYGLHVAYLRSEKWLKFVSIELFPVQRLI
jgi:hypothetical protein